LVLPPVEVALGLVSFELRRKKGQGRGTRQFEKWGI
jgi:hypothetical protein